MEDLHSMSLPAGWGLNSEGGAKIYQAPQKSEMTLIVNGTLIRRCDYKTEEAWRNAIAILHKKGISNAK